MARFDSPFACSTSASPLEPVRIIPADRLKGTKAVRGTSQGIRPFRHTAALTTRLFRFTGGAEAIHAFFTLAYQELSL